MVSTASVLGARHLGEVVENKPASLFVVFLGKALNRTPLILRGKQVARPGGGWAPPGILSQDSLHDEHHQNKLD